MTRSLVFRLPLVVVAFALASRPLLAQGETGFLRGEGHTDVVLNFARDSYDHFWAGTTRVDNSGPGFGRVTRTSYNLFVAHGVNPDLDLSANLPYVISDTASGGLDREADFQDLGLQAKWRVGETRLGPGAASFLVAPGIKAPLTSYEENDVTAIGDGQTDYRGRAIVHYGFDCGAFVSLETGYDRRAGLPKDETPWNITVGATFLNRVTVSPFYSAVRSYGGKDIGDPGFSFPETREEFDRRGVGIYLRVCEGFGLAGYWRQTTDGRNTGDADGFAVGSVLRF